MNRSLQQLLKEQRTKLEEQQGNNDQLIQELINLRALNDALIDEHKDLLQEEQICQQEKDQLQNIINNLQHQLNQQNSPQNNNDRNLAVLWRNNALQTSLWKASCYSHLDQNLIWNGYN
jgi:predicted nuclease with TOPRIM domain